MPCLRPHGPAFRSGSRIVKGTAPADVRPGWGGVRMNANLDYIGMLNLLRGLVSRGIITREEKRKIAARIATDLCATIVAND